MIDQSIVDAFRRTYMTSNDNGDGTMGSPWMRYRGRVALQHPFDVFLLQEIIWELKPHFIVELGRNDGGLTLFIADLMEKYAPGAAGIHVPGLGAVYSVDLDAKDVEHPRVVNLSGDTLSSDTASPFDCVTDAVCGNRGPILILHDAGHSVEHVTAELALWTKLMQNGDVLVVADTQDGGPWWGVRSYLPPGHKFKRLHDPPTESFEFTVGDRTFRSLPQSWKFLMTNHGWYEAVE